MSNITIPIRGMHCASCEILIAEKVKKVPGVTSVHVSLKKACADIEYGATRPSDAVIALAIQEAGYEVGKKEKQPWFSRNAIDYKDLAKAAGILLILYLVGKRFGLFDLTIDTPNTGVYVALLVGLVAGISTCMA